MPRYLILLFIAVIVGWLGYGLLRALLGPDIMMVVSLIVLAIVGVVVYRNLKTNRKVADASAEQRTDALRFAPTDGKAALYLYRNQFVGRAVGVNVLIDGQEVAQLKSPRFTRVLLAPGAHRIAGYTGTNKPPSDSAGLALTANAGDVLIVKCEVEPQMVGAVVKSTPQPLERGRADVQKISRMVIADVAEL